MFQTLYQALSKGQRIVLSSGERYSLLSGAGNLPDKSFKSFKLGTEKIETAIYRDASAGFFLDHADALERQRHIDAQYHWQPLGAKTSGSEKL